MIVLSLFDGISCGRLALQRAGIKVDTYYASEIDKYAIQITQKNFPDTIQLGDVTKWREWNIDWKSIDLLIGGSPCQTFSNAGTRTGFDGKSGLFYTYLEILNHLKSINPNIKFLLENVKMKSEWRDEITRCMGVEPVLINSALVSAQQRNRYYWCNWNVEQPQDKHILLKDILEKEVNEKYFMKYDFEFYGFDKNVCGIVNMKANECPRRIYSPQFKCATLMCDGNGGNLVKKTICNGKLRKLTPVEYERLQTLPDNYTDCCCDSKRYTAIGNGWTVDVIAYIFTTMDKPKFKEELF